MSESTPSQYRCRDCQSTSVNPRNLAIFIGGTENKPGSEETNVKKLYDVVVDGNGNGPERKQQRFYLEGIGARRLDNLPLSKCLEKWIYSQSEVITAWNVRENVQDAYKWLVENYNQGDQIYLFGFSRGAYQVRALAGMIHEVGLLKHGTQRRIEQAYCHYLSIHPNNPRARDLAIKFKKDFCWYGLRIHFIGVWDTVSSLGLTKKDVHITASASVTNACHFRHALALDERRVKFLPEFFVEMNAHRGDIQSSRTAVSDVKEVWFAGCHSDVGGTSRPGTEGLNPAGDEHHSVHAGNVPFVWMQREAAANGLNFTLDGLAWYPEDIDFGRKDSMTLKWILVECLRIRHQVSFSGTGKHKKRFHFFRPRSVLPGQHFHFSVLPGDRHMPRATLAHGVDLPIVSQEDSGALWKTEPWASELSDESATTHLLTSLLRDQQKTLASLGEVLLLLDLRLDNRHSQGIPIPEWLGGSIRRQSGSEKFTLTVIYDAISNFSMSDSGYSELLNRARHSLKARHEKLRQRFIAHDDVIGALLIALERTAMARDTENLFSLVVDSLCYLIHDVNKRDYVIGRLTAAGTNAGPTRLLQTLEVKARCRLIASLRMVTILAQYPASFTATDQLKSKIWKLAKKEKPPVGSAAVEALVALGEEIDLRRVRFSNVMGYLNNALPWLEAEVGNASPPNATVPLLASVSQIDDSGTLDQNDEVARRMLVQKLLQTIVSRNAHERTMATLALLKLLRDQTIRAFCPRKVMNTFLKQLERKATSLLAAYALNTCLKYDMWTSENFSEAAKSIQHMLERGWFDDAIGRVEGSEIFRELMESGNLRQKVIDCDIVTILVENLKSGDRHKVRISLICLDIILEKGGLVDLGPRVVTSLTYLKNEDRRIQTKGVKMLSALAQTKAGEEAIRPHVNDIVKMLLPPPDRSPIPRWKIFGATAALYDLCKNETLRQEILKSDHYATLKNLRRDSTLYPRAERP